MHIVICTFFLVSLKRPIDNDRSAHSRSQGWLRDLTALLEAHPEALVGEIGMA